MVGSFTFNSVNTSSFSIVPKSVKRPLLPQSKTNMVKPLGSSGVYDFGLYEYDIRTITMKLQYIGTSFEELRTRARQIAAWLSTNDFKQLIFDDEPTVYYLAKVVDEVDLDTLMESGEADVTFTCQPFAVSIEEKTYEFDSGDLPNCVFTNNGTRKTDYLSQNGSKSIISVAGSWTTLTLELNGYALAFDLATSGQLDIDNVNMTCKIGETSFLDNLSGDIDAFLPVFPGDNTLIVGGTGLVITSIIVNFNELWI